LGLADRVHVATKVRLTGDDLGDIRAAVRRSFAESLERLRLPRVTLLQLHNSVTPRRGDEPTSITPNDVLGPGGVLEAFDELRREGRVLHLGLTGIGNPSSMKDVMNSGAFATLQIPYHLLNSSAGTDESPEDGETNFGNMIGTAAKQGMGVFAIRVLAGGALADAPPSAHTYKTPFFPLDLYHRDRERAARLREMIGPERRLPIEAIRFALAHPQITSAIVGFGEPAQIGEALMALEADSVPIDWSAALNGRPTAYHHAVEDSSCRTSVD
jgi:aryl-alcohol dehydrogenase-like predicted oxidoreductase